MRPRLDVKRLADEIAVLIVGHQQHDRLKWYEAGRVRVLVGRILPKGSAVKRTLDGRRKRFRDALAERLGNFGWRESQPNRYVRDSSMSLEELAYEVRYYGDDDEIHGSICQAVMRLPRAVQDFACEKVRLLVGRTILLWHVRPPDVVRNPTRRRARSVDCPAGREDT